MRGSGSAPLLAAESERAVEQDLIDPCSTVVVVKGDAFGVDVVARDDVESHVLVERDRSSVGEPGDALGTAPPASVGIVEGAFVECRAAAGAPEIRSYAERPIISGLHLVCAA